MINRRLATELRALVEHSATPVSSNEAKIRAVKNESSTTMDHSLRHGQRRPRLLVTSTGLLVVAIIIFAVAVSGGHRNSTSRLAVTLLTSTGTPYSASPRDAVASNGAGWTLTTKGLEVTTNGGSSFTLVSAPVPVTTIGDVAFNGQVIVLAGQKDFKPWVEYSSTRGASWTNVQLPKGGNNAGNVQLVEEANIVVGMQVTDVTSSNFSVGEWYSTKDGGRAWNYHGYTSGGVVTAENGVLWLAGGPVFNRLYESQNFGDTWLRVLLPAVLTTEGAALSSPQPWGNGEWVLAAQIPTSNSGSTYGLSIYLSRDLGASWSLDARTTLPGSIGVGVNAATAVSSGVLWIGSEGGSPRLLRFQEGRGFSDTSSIGPYPDSSVTAVSDFGTKSLWATVQGGVCPISGQTICQQMEVGTLSITHDGGRSWNPVDLTPKSISPN